jgi:hypothetical protein
MRSLTLAGLIGICLGSALSAQEPVVLTIHPRAIESPVLKYRLFPPEAELKPGNAVPILLRLPWEQTNYVSSDTFRNLDDWNERPLTSPEWKDFPQSFSNRFYGEMKRAAYRRDAVWEYPIGEEPPYFILLPDVQGMRQWLGRGLSAKIRYHLSRGELDQAREGILVGLANARHIAATPFLVNQLVANAIHRIMLDRVAELISQPDSPNLYWALSALPDSLVELKRAADLEGSMFLMTFPAAADMERPRGAAEWREMLQQWHELNRYLNRSPPDKLKEAAADPSPLVKIARAELPQLLKVPAEQVASMADDEAAVRWLVHVLLQQDQREAAALCLAPREALPLLKQLRADNAAIEAKIGAARIELLDPTAGYLALWSLQRKIAALRIVEAVRNHLAIGGKLPAKLDEITAVPVPLDPLTGQPFVWKVEGMAATLAGPELPEDLAPRGPMGQRPGLVEYRLEVK